MSSFDEYIPDPPLLCPTCGSRLESWQGKDGPCEQLVWRQGEISPIHQAVDPQWRLTKEILSAQRLPNRFLIYPGGPCRCSAVYVALGQTDGEARWTSSQVVTTDEGRSFYDSNWRT